MATIKLTKDGKLPKPTKWKFDHKALLKISKKIRKLHEKEKEYKYNHEQ